MAPDGGPGPRERRRAPKLWSRALDAVLAAGVARRKRVAHVFLVVYFILQLGYDALLLSALFLMAPEDFGDRPPPWWAREIVAANLVITLAVLIVLALSRQEFYARVQRGSLRQALSVLVALLAVFTAI